METFPIEGKISTITLNEKQIQYLEEYLIKEKGITDSKMSKSGSSGIGWNNNSYWYIKDFNKSGKNEYAYFQISKFIENKDEFKKGDYIVILKGQLKEIKGAYLENNCYKCSKDSRHLFTEVDSKGSFSNGFYTVSYDNKNTVRYSGAMAAWRYATKQEVEHYNKINKPYDVTTIVSIEPWSVGSYIVALKDGSIAISKFKKGDLAIITDDKHINLLSDNSKWSCTSKMDNVEVKWFATKSEALEFAKTLVEVKPEWNIGDAFEVTKNRPNDSELETGIVYYIYRVDKYDILASATKNGKPLDAGYVEFKYMKKVKPESYDYDVVHCTTQEEWDFAISKCGTNSLISKESHKFNIYCKENPSGIAVCFEDDSYCSLDWWKENNAKIYTFKEWCDINNFTFESKPQFIVGKWYKNLNILSYRRCSKTGDDLFYDEWIPLDITNKWSKDSGRAIWKNVQMLEDLSEIQQYLPEGHVDKINTYIPQVGDWVILFPENYSKSFYKDAAYYCKQYAPTTAFQIKKFSSNNVKEGGFIKENGWNFPIDCFRKAQPHEIPVTKPEHQLEVGKYYVTSYGDQGWYIFIATESLQNCTYINIDSKIFIESKGNFTSKNGFKVFQIASKEQIEWLDRCISANKFVPKELTKDELLEIAKSKYPVGTKYIPTFRSGTDTDTSTGEFKWDDDFIIDSSNYTTVYVKTRDKWAEIVDKPNTTSFTADFKWESKSPANTMAERMNINGTYVIMNGGNVCNEIELPKNGGSWVHVGKPEVELQLKGKVHLDTTVNEVKSTSTNLYKKSKSIIFNNN